MISASRISSTFVGFKYMLAIRKLSWSYTKIIELLAQIVEYNPQFHKICHPNDH